MAKLDKKRKIVIVTIVAIGLCAMFWGRSSQGEKHTDPVVVSEATLAPVVEKTAVPEAALMVQEEKVPKAQAGINREPTPAEIEAMGAPQSQDYGSAVSSHSSPGHMVVPAYANGEAKPKPPKPMIPFKNFTVYMNKGSFNHYSPSGYMPIAKCATMDDAWRDNCQDGSTCIKVSFDGECAKKNMGWAGVYWLDGANNWGDEKGGYNLTGAEKLSFWAKGEKGGEVITVKMGGIGMNRKYEDSTTESIGPVILTKDWKEYTINLKGKDLSRIIGGFVWVANAKDNPALTVFYIDEIQYK